MVKYAKNNDQNEQYFNEEGMKSTFVSRFGFIFTVLFLIAMCLAGCGKGPKKVSVSGKVTLDGEPIQNCSILFQAVNPGGDAVWRPDATGVTDAEGRYALSSIGANGGPGAAAGDYVVKFGWLNPNPPADESEAPARPPYQLPEDAQINGIKFTVPAKGADDADFHLTGAKK